MKVDFALFVEAANHGPEGVLNVLGSFDVLVTDALPVVRPQLTGVLWFRGDDADVFPARVWLRLMTETGDVGLWDTWATIDREAGKEHLPVKGEIIFQAFGILFPAPGDYFLFVQNAFGQDLYRKRLEIRLRVPTQSP